MTSVLKTAPLYLPAFLIVLLVCPPVSPIQLVELKDYYDITLNDKKLDDCLFWRVDKKGEAYMSLICQEALDKTDLETAWQIVNGHKNDSYLQNLYISCETCICMEYHRTTQLVLTKEADTSTSLHKVMNYTEVSHKACTMPRSIRSDMLEPFYEIEVLLLSSPSVQRIDLSRGNGSGLLPYLTTLYITATSNLDIAAFGSSGLCRQLPSLAYILITKNMVSFPKEWFVPEIQSEAFSLNAQSKCYSLEELLVHGSTFNKLQNGTFDFAINLTHLRLTNDQIHMIHEGAFQGLSSLEFLKLSNNSIAIIPEYLFEPLKNVSNIELDYNKLNIFNTSTLLYLTNLKVLDLSHNVLTDIIGSFQQHLINLSLSYNFLTQIQNQTFRNSSELQYLLMSNNKISSIDYSSFQFLSKVQVLDLSTNNLHDAEHLRDNIIFLSKLRIFNVSHNRLSTLLPNMFANLSGLIILDVSSNNIHTINNNSFDHLEYLFQLQMDNNPLTKVQHSVFYPLHTLKLLHLANTSLTNFSLMWTGYWIWVLDLSRNNLHEIPKCNVNWITVLKLNQNFITELSEMDLMQYPSLSQLELGWNRLSKIHPFTFVATNINSLDLSHNELNSESWNGTTETPTEALHLPRTLTYLNLAYNHLRTAYSFEIYERMQSITIDLSSNPLQYFVIDPLPKLTMIMQSCNLTGFLFHKTPIEYKRQYDFNEWDLKYNLLTEIEPLNMDKGNKDYRVDLRGNMLKCSCRMKWLLQHKYMNHYDVDYCEDILTNKNILFENVPDNRFLCLNPMGPKCPVDEKFCTCFTNDPHIRITILVECSNRNLTDIPLSIPTTAKTLRLDGNNFQRLNAQMLISTPNNEAMDTEVLSLENSQIMYLEGETFVRMPYLKELHLEYNHIQFLNKDTLAQLYRLEALFLNANKIMHIEEGAFEVTVSLETLNLAGNMLEHLNQSTLKEIGALEFAGQVSLGDNPWTCECDNLTFKGWLQDHDHFITDMTSITCNDTAIVNIPDDDLLCYDDVEFQVVTKHNTNWTTVAVTSTIAAIATCLFIAGVITYQKRVICKVLLYKYFNFRPYVKENPDCQYDAFVIYDNNNPAVPEWVITVLLKKLEPPFRVCIPNRNILLGTVWADALSDAINASRRTILVLSGSGMEDEYILYTFQVAYHHSKYEDPTHRIFCILLEDADEKALIDSELTDPHVKSMLRAGQHFHVDDKMFWEKVMFCMPKPQPRDDEDNFPMYYVG